MTVNNKDIWDFFQANPSIDFENAILVLIDIFDITLKNAENTINSKINTRILSSLHELKTDVSSIKQDIVKSNADLNCTLLIRFNDIKKEYIEEMKNIVVYNGTTSLDKMASLVERNNSSLVDKTQLLLADILPRTNDQYYRQIQESIQYFQKNMLDETAKMFSQSKPHETLDEFISTFDTKFIGLTQPIYNIIAASEDRINKNLTQMREHTIAKEAVQERLLSELDEFLNKNKYKNSTVRGKSGETQLEEILNHMFPSALVRNTTGTAASGDFILQERGAGKYDILFENKVYTSNVNNDEVLKFVRDVKQHRCNGILLSQTSGIVSKQPFQVEVIDSLIVVYVLNCEYDPDKIKIAVDIIDTLAACLDTYLHASTHENAMMSPEMVQKINEEYSKFGIQKLALIENVKLFTKEMTKKLTDQIDEFKIPTLHSFLSTHFGNYNVSAVVAADQLACKHCNKLWGSRAALASHMKGCAKKSAGV